MKSVIYWFSGTGNSFAVAKDLAGALGETELIPIAGDIKRHLQPCERMGVVFPVYAFGLPVIVKKFLRQAPVGNAEYIYTVATMGGIAGAVHRETAGILAESGATLAAGWSVAMPNNYPVLKPPPSRDKQKLILAKALARVEKIAAAIAGKTTGIFEDTRKPLRWPLEFIHNMAGNKFADADGNFTVSSKCIHCAICARVCPVANIRMVEKNPVWMHHCEQCMACLQWCPVQAIEYGRSTVGKERYHHPRFKASDLFLREE
jgi:ferredoxin